MAANEVIRSTCLHCPGSCGVLIHMDNGKPVKIEGDPDSPISKGALCVKGSASLEFLYHPDRLKYPLRRTGERGKGQWKRISWDEALKTIADKLMWVKDKYGAESLLMIRGGARGLQDDFFARFANSFGTPNLATFGSVCKTPKIYASRMTYGYYTMPEYEYPPACIMVWGANRAETGIIEFKETVQALNKGTKIIIVDPRKIGLSQRADLCLQLRPGSDLVLALGLINVIINEALYDRAFVDRWTVGFEEIKAHIQDYPPEMAEEITWVNAEAIKKAARLFAKSRPACIQWGVATDTNVNSFQTARAISILRAITGNLDVPGGELLWPSIGLLNRLPGFDLRDKLPTDKCNKGISAGDKLLPSYTEASPQRVIRAIIDKDPYPIRAAYIRGANLLLSYYDSQEVYRALNELDFFVTADMFMTPTAALADIVLPVTSYLEFDDVVHTINTKPVVQVQQKVAQLGECWSDSKIINELAKRVGLGEYFWNDMEEALDAILKPLGLTFEEFKRIGAVSISKRYREYEVNGFATPSQKVELYSSKLKEWGFDPLPKYYEPPETPYSDPELSKEYPLIFTSWKAAEYRHSSGKEITTLRGIHPEPVVHIHPETAGHLGINEGDWVYIETKRGKIKQKAFLTDSLDPRVVGVDFGWWFPEKGISNLYGWKESNINILTENNKSRYNREMGSATLRGILCKVYKVS